MLRLTLLSLTLISVAHGGGVLDAQRASGSQTIVIKPKRGINPDKEPINVFIFNLLQGSHYKNSKELAYWLSSLRFEDGSPKYNITSLVWKDNTDLKESETLHIHRLPMDCPFDEEYVSKNARTIADIIEVLIEFIRVEAKILGEHISVLRELQEYEFDVGLVDCMGSEAIINDMLDTPWMMQYFYMPSVALTETFYNPLQLNTLYPF